MAGTSRYAPTSAAGRFFHGFEEGVIALLIGAMTLLTFVNVVLRYLFNALNVWSLEVVTIMFAWLVLFGVAYGFKITAHLGVDAVLNVVNPRVRWLLGVASCIACLAYALLILKGAWDYWAPFADMHATSGRWFPTGFATTRSRSFMETGQVPMPDWLRFLEHWINYDERYSKLPVVIPYAILPIAAVMILWRLIEATVRIVKGTQESLIASHEAEDLVEEAAAANAARKDA